jgi:hypothetical protein
MSERLLTTREASEFLAERGVSRKPATLNRLRCQGGGPEFKKFGRAVYYEPATLLRFINERLSPPLRSTSDRGTTFGQLGPSK